MENSCSIIAEFEAVVDLTSSKNRMISANVIRAILLLKVTTFPGDRVIVVNVLFHIERFGSLSIIAIRLYISKTNPIKGK